MRPVQVSYSDSIIAADRRRSIRCHGRLKGGGSGADNEVGEILSGCAVVEDADENAVSKGSRNLSSIRESKCVKRDTRRGRQICLVSDEEMAATRRHSPERAELPARSLVKLTVERKNEMCSVQSRSSV